MNFFRSIISVVFMFSITMDTMKIVSADRMVRFIFNNGVAPSSSTYCSDSDNAKINAIFGDNAVMNRRERDLLSFISNETIPTKSDERQLFAGYCKNNCAGHVAKTCRATGCVGYRRGRELGYDSNSEDERSLQVSCANHLTSITNSLNALISNNQISSTCKSYLSASKRSTSCYDDVIYGEIEGVKVWDLSSSTATVMSDSMPISGFSFCASKKFSLTSINHPCVDQMKFELYGPNGYTHVNDQYGLPYSIFYEDDNGNLKGRILSKGTYTLKMTPDLQYNKQKIFYFTLNNC